jgi:hypothetical protein
MTYPDAPIIGLCVDAFSKIVTVRVRCPFCRGVHTHDWHNEADGLRTARCTPHGAIYVITVDTWARIKAMREQYPADNGVVGLIPLSIHYAFEQDGNDDIVGIVLDTTLGEFAVWLPLPSAVQLASQLVDIADDADRLRDAYVKRLEASLQD